MGKHTKLLIQYRNGRLPDGLEGLLDNADETDLRVLIALLMAADGDGIAATLELGERLGLGQPEVDASLKFWRGAGVLKPLPKSGKETSAPAEKKEKTESKITEQPKKTAHRGGALERSGVGDPYTSAELAELIERRQISAQFIDEAQRVMGKVFRSYDTGILVGIVDRLGFEEAAVLAILAYVVHKEKRTMRYAEQVAMSLYDAGITETADVLDRISRMERSGEVIAKIKALFGIGERELTTTEKRIFSTWTEKFAYDMDVIRLAYEITVDTIQKPVPKYANSILEAWYAEGLRTAEEVRRHVEGQKQEKKNGTTEKTYDVQDFFEATLQRSYEDLK